MNYVLHTYIVAFFPTYMAQIIESYQESYCKEAIVRMKGHDLKTVGFERGSYTTITLLVLQMTPLMQI